MQSVEHSVKVTITIDYLVFSAVYPCLISKLGTLPLSQWVPKHPDSTAIYHSLQQGS